MTEVKAYISVAKSIRRKHKEGVIAIMWTSKTKFLVTTLIVLSTGVVALSALPARIATADLVYPTTMPLVFVDPQNATANPGEIITISVKIFNLTDTYYATNTAWLPGDEQLGPPGGIMNNYSLGNLYGFDVQFSWNPNVLQYVSHTLKVPVETHPDGILHEAIQGVLDLVDEVAGTYWLAQSSLDPAPLFNNPDANSTVFTMTFEVIKKGVSELSLDSVDLSTTWSMGDKHKQKIPHVVRSSEFKTALLATSIETLSFKARVDDQSFKLPIISGEDGILQVFLRNDNLTFADTYNLTLYYDDNALGDGTWLGRTLNPQDAETLNYTFAAADLTTGSHTIKAVANILHAGEILTDQVTEPFDVIDTPVLTVSSPATATSGQEASFDASQSTHPSGTISKYSWSFYAPGEALPKFNYEGESIKHTFDRNAKNGTWRIVLKVEDSFGLTHNPSRPSTAPYLKEVTLDLTAQGPGSPFSLENIALIAILIVVIVAAVLYLRRRSR